MSSFVCFSICENYCTLSSFYQRAANHVFFCPLFNFAKLILPYRRARREKRYDKEKSLETVVVSRLFWWTIQDLNLDLISIIFFYVSKTGGMGIKICI